MCLVGPSDHQFHRENFTCNVYFFPRSGFTDQRHQVSQGRSAELGHFLGQDSICIPLVHAVTCLCDVYRARWAGRASVSIAQGSQLGPGGGLHPFGATTHVPAASGTLQSLGGDAQARPLAQLTAPIPPHQPPSVPGAGSSVASTGGSGEFESPASSPPLQAAAQTAAPSPRVKSSDERTLDTQSRCRAGRARLGAVTAHSNA